MPTAKCRLFILSFYSSVESRNSLYGSPVSFPLLSFFFFPKYRTKIVDSHILPNCIDPGKIIQSFIKYKRYELKPSTLNNHQDDRITPSQGGKMHS